MKIHSFFFRTRAYQFLLLSLVVAFASGCGSKPQKEDVASTPQEESTTTEQGSESHDTDTPATTNQADPTKFATIVEMVAEVGDYSVDDKTFEKVEDAKVKIFPAVPASADETQIKNIVQASLVEFVMRTFIHTDLENVTVAVVPKKASINPSEAEAIKGKDIEVTVSRQKAVEVAKKHAGVEPKKLVGNMLGDLYRADMRNGNMDKLTTTDVETVYNELTAK